MNSLDIPFMLTGKTRCKIWIQFFCWYCLYCKLHCTQMSCSSKACLTFSDSSNIIWQASDHIVRNNGPEFIHLTLVQLVHFFDLSDGPHWLVALLGSLSFLCWHCKYSLTQIFIYYNFCIVFLLLREFINLSKVTVKTFKMLQNKLSF